MNIEGFVQAYKNLRSTCTAPPRRVFVRSKEADELKTMEGIEKLVGKDEKTGEFKIDGVTLEIVNYMVDPIYMFW